MERVVSGELYDPVVSTALLVVNYVEVYEGFRPPESKKICPNLSFCLDRVCQAKIGLRAQIRPIYENCHEELWYKFRRHDQSSVIRVLANPRLSPKNLCDVG